MNKDFKNKTRIGNQRNQYLMRRGVKTMSAATKTDPLTKIRQMEQESQEYDNANYLLVTGKLTRQEFERQTKGYQDSLFDFSGSIVRQTS